MASQGHSKAHFLWQSNLLHYHYKTVGAFHSTKNLCLCFRNFCWSNGTGPRTSKSCDESQEIQAIPSVECICCTITDIFNVFVAFKQGHRFLNLLLLFEGELHE